MKLRNLVVAATLVVAVAVPASADPNEDRLSSALDAMAALCPISTNADAQQHAREKAITEGMETDPPTFIHGPPPGTHSTTVTINSYAIDINVREGPSGLCAVSFDTMSANAIATELSRRFGQGQPFAQGVRWTVRRPDGDAGVYFRPFVPGQSGPGWIGLGDYMLGLDAAQPKDIIVFYTPGQRGELDSLSTLGNR